MDMMHDFRPDPEVRAVDTQPKTWLPELYAIVAILAVLWTALAVHVMAHGSPW